MERDPLLRRLERTSMVVCGVTALGALALARGRPGPAAAVVGGWLLIAISYRAIAAGIDAVIGGPGASADPAARRRRLIVGVAKMAGRYALLVVFAYVMIARLRLHPLGLLAGVSSVVAAASVEAIRLLVKKS